MKRILAVVVQLAGVASVAVAGFVVAAALGWLVAGFGLLVVGVALERGSAVADDVAAPASDGAA